MGGWDIARGQRSVCLSVCLCVCLSVCPSVCLSVCLSVCVCHPLIAKRTHLHFYLSSSFIFPFHRRGPEAHIHDSGQRRRLSAECEAIWDARLCTCSLYRTALQTVGIDFSRAVRTSASVGATPSKELCKCVTSTGILSRGRA